MKIFTTALCTLLASFLVFVVWPSFTTLLVYGVMAVAFASSRIIRKSFLDQVTRQR